jgi:hypothetical protein
MGLDQALRPGKTTPLAFTGELYQSDILMAAAQPDVKYIHVTYHLLRGTASALQEQDTQVLKMLSYNADAEEGTEMVVAKGYQPKFTDRKLAFEYIQTGKAGDIYCASKQKTRKFNLTKLEFRKLKVVLKTGCHFGASSKKLTKMMKYQLTINFSVWCKLRWLSQGEVVESFPPNTQNYSKAVASLKTVWQFFLVEVNVRGVLNVVCPGTALFSGRVSKPWHRRVCTTQEGQASERSNSLMEFLRLKMGDEETITFAMASLGLMPEALISVYTNKHSSKKGCVLYVQSLGMWQNKANSKCVVCGRGHVTLACKVFKSAF